ncbi:MAG: hypothetical protein ACI97A_000705 [Planctomycetota bacterium]|jgi:hypothetical protein
MRHITLLGSVTACILAACLLSCGDSGPNDAPQARPQGAFSPIADAMTKMEDVEELSETVANRLIEFSYRLRERDLRGARAYLANDFKGSALKITGKETRKNLPLGAKEILSQAADDQKMIGRDAFLESLDSSLTSFETLDHVFFKTRGAEFSLKGNRALLKMTASIIGTTENDGRRSIYAWAEAAAYMGESGWVLSGFKVLRTREKIAETSLFTDVADVAGIAVDGPRVGTAGNDKFYWRGASVIDLDRDGLDDIFSSGLTKNYLYHNQGDGTFKDIAVECGLAEPTGPTSVVFFDYDRDGDDDVFMAFVGWEDDGLPLGNSLKLLRNDSGKFTDVSVAMGLGNLRGPSFSSIAGDFNNDGWLDLYVCNYERLDAAYPDSWFGATNGAANFLLMNQAGKKFKDEAPARGVAGKHWTFAAAAADFDQDGDLDIYSVNDYGTNALLVNDGQGQFTDQAEEYGVLDCGNGMGATWGDINNDGKLDLYVSNMSSSAGKRILNRLVKKDQARGVQKTLYKLAAGNSIFLNNGKTFTATTSEAGGQGASWAWSPLVFDADLDGNADLYVANGFISGDSLKDT